ncbi:MAG: MarR family transcriptional regulator [Mixta calida]|uniref:MarR family transcriptional regulator n=1 Tax=Mixta calida TaxID=665913 RepID=A0ABM6S0N7_9GAMM|nr:MULTISPECIES: MarR family transcriptional regulator [Mixta]MBS6058081.1 MarR family transcriptional regulator [Pantoea sp.]POU51569.1 MarR family transcriptional regulator [Pantoea sp. PSNIH5]POU69363.1 MarR family transcriptional regulator [Pantoea sp. PSNIH4]POY69466.1 MarR family transcriptional regulator [Pantoea sp. PSNIH3]AUY24861.1 MarR family transcriptional regulator [Mixta calida]
MDSQQRFSRLLHLAAHAWRLAIDRRLKESGLSMNSWLAVATLASESEPMTQKALAQVLGLEEASVVPLVDRLVAQQLVERSQPEEDRRKRLLLVTEQGNALFNKVKVETDRLRGELLADIDRDELAIAQRVLQQLLDKTGTL